jgi:hypothetical protein
VIPQKKQTSQPALSAESDEYLAGTQINTQSSKPAVFTDTTGGLFRIGVPRILRSDSHLEIETSSDLISWTSTEVTDFSSQSMLLGGISFSGVPKGFLRIKAVTNP